MLLLLLPFFKFHFFNFYLEFNQQMGDIIIAWLEKERKKRRKWLFHLSLFLLKFPFFFCKQKLMDFLLLGT